ncbi:DUF4190 domain-containing protein, partial [Streptomyces lunaelactis]
PNPADHKPAGQDPWGPPPSGPALAHFPPHPMLPAPVAPVSNGMGITALVLGITGVVLGLVIFLFWMSWLPALLAVVFGFIGLSQVRKGLANNRAMALTGAILGIVGLLIAVGGGVFAVTMVKRSADDTRAKADEAKASASSAEKDRHLSFGETYTYENGLKVTVAAPQPFTPDEYAYGHAKGNKAVQVTVTVINTSTSRVSVKTGLPDVNDANGASAELVIDGSGRQKVITGYLLPGKEAVGKYAFSLPPDAAGRIEVEFSPDAMRWNDAYWSGPTS